MFCMSLEVRFYLLLGFDESQMMYWCNFLLLILGWEQCGEVRTSVRTPATCSMSEHKWCLWQWQSGSWSANTRILADLYLTNYTRSSSTQTFVTIKIKLHKNMITSHSYFISTQHYFILCNYFLHVFFFLAIGIIPSFEYYKFTNMRPPFTYASMIRWVSTDELNILYITFSFPV